MMISKTNTLQGNDLMNSANAGVAFWYKNQTGVTYYFKLRQMNDSLLNENTRLHQLLAKQSETDILNDSSAVHSFISNYSAHKIQYAHFTYYKARVVNNSVNASSNFITINRGFKDGIAKNMAVVSSTGVVGRITNVSAHFATALSVLNTRQRLSAKLTDGTASFVYWDESRGPDQLLMKITQPEINVREGDSILTTSYSTVFPADMLVGRVQKVFLVKKDNSRLLQIKPATNFHNMQFVYCIKNEFIEERRALEGSTQKAAQNLK